jgi:hypothetical protein
LSIDDLTDCSGGNEIFLSFLSSGFNLDKMSAKRWPDARFDLLDTFSGHIARRKA